MKTTRLLKIGFLAGISLLIFNRAAAQTCSNPNAGGATCFVQYQAVEAGLTKCGFTEFYPSDPPRVRKYHNQTTTVTHAYYYSWSGDGPWFYSDSDPDGDYDQEEDSPGSYSGNMSYSYGVTEYEHYLFQLSDPGDSGSCFYTNSFSGGWTLSGSGSDQRTFSWEADTADGSAGGVQSNWVESIDDSMSPAYVTGYSYGYYSGPWWFVENDVTSGSYLLANIWGPDPPYPSPGSTISLDSTSISTNEASTPPMTTINGASVSPVAVSPTLEQADLSATLEDPTILVDGWVTDAPPVCTDTGSGTVTLDTEYTDGELYNNIMSLMPAYPNPPSWTQNFTYADSVISADYIDGSELTSDGNAQLQQMEYQFGVPDSAAWVQYTITWDLITWDVAAGTVTTTSESTTVQGTGDPNNPAMSQIFQVAPPYWDETGAGFYVFTWVDNVKISVSNRNSNNMNVAGSGPLANAASGNGGGCSACGNSTSNNGSGGLSAVFNLGNETNGYSVDSLKILSASPSPALATPAGLTCNTNDPEVQVIMANNQIRQVYAPQALADIETNNSYSYQINYYLPSQVGSMVGGVYQLTGSPFVSWTIQNPNGSTNDNILQITETRGTTNEVYTWTYSATNSSSSWALDYPGGLREDKWVTTIAPWVDPNNNTNYSRTVVYTIGPPNGPDQYMDQQTYDFIGSIRSGGGGEELVQEIVGPDSNPQTNTYTYSSGGSATFKPLQLAVHPDGSWQFYDYTTVNLASVSIPVLADIYSPIGDEPPPSPGNYPDYYQCRVLSYYYSSVEDPPDAYTNDLTIPRLTYEYYADNPLFTTFTVISPGERQDIQCPVPFDFWYGSTSDLVTTTMYYTSGPNTNRVESILNPDGTMQIYTYSQAANGSQTNIIYSGQPNSAQTAIINGTEDVTVLGAFGQMISHAVTDIASGITLVQDTYSDYDQFNRPQIVTHLDGTTEDTQYSSCCSTLESTTDRDGMSTLYLYDQANRQVGYENLYGSTAITYSNTLDAVGRTIQSIRIGSDDSAITLSQSQYNTANQLTEQVNGLGGTSTYIQANDPNTDGRISITINPDGGTVTNFYYDDGTLKETIGTAVHGNAYNYGYATDINGNDCTYTVETNLNADGSLSSEWTETFNDILGQQTETLYANGAYSQSFYNASNQLAAEIDPDGVTNLYAYDAKGEQTYSAVDMNGNGSIDFAGTDRITETTNDVTTDHSASVSRTRTYAWTQNGSGSPTLISMQETSANGLDFWQTGYRDASTPVTSGSQTSYGGSGARTTTLTAPDGSYTVNDYSYGRLTSTTRYDSTGVQISGTTYSYDAHGRQYQVTDARNGTTTYEYNNADLVTNVTTPNPGGGSPETTITYYNQILQATDVVQPDGTSVSSAYLLTGELGLQYGSRTYPVGYSYDYAGRMKTMTNWSNFNGDSGARVTTWNYDPYRGFLTSKTYDGGAAGPSYTYTSAGRLSTRTWARGTSTTYSYDGGGTLAGVSYSDSTPSVAYTNDRQGRPATVVRNSMTDALSYNLANQLVSEAFSGGILNNLSVSNTYDSDLRRTTLSALSSGSPLFATTYGYDDASRLSSASDGNGNSANYSYVANSPLVSQIVYKQGSSTRMTTSKTYDYLNRLTQISSAPSAAYTQPLTFDYNYNPANQRTKDTLADGSYWIYGYDSLGQVTNGVKYFSNGTPVAGQQFDYAFDTIGNRTKTLAGGDQNGANLRTASYYANNLNQLTNRDVAGDVDVMGASILPLTNTVTVNGQTAYRNQEYFRQQVPVNNSSSALWTNMTVTGGQTVSGYEYVPEEPEHFSYDADGNLTNDGRWAYVWDGENRLIQMTVNTNVGPQYQLNFAYDYQGRRIQKAVASSGTPVYTNDFLYDGWNLIAETTLSDSLIRSYVRGLDLSGSIQGAGGVGGLLELSYYGASTTNCFVAFDGNGNVMELVNATNGTVAANYDYGPFGEPIRIDGLMGTVNPFRFSTKYDDDESDLLYYGYRYYKPSTGTWPNRDPIQELSFYSFSIENEISGDNDLAESTANLLGDDDGDSLNLIAGGPNVYAFIQNNPANSIDDLGLTVYLQSHKAVPPIPINHSYVLMVVGCGSVWLGSPYFVGNPMPGEPGEQYATIGAGPKHGLLVSGVNRPRDAKLSLENSSVIISPPSGMSDDDFIAQLFGANARYPDSYRVPYALFPTQNGPSYNSNSYASGILLFVTGSMPPRPPRTPGFNKPVPGQDF